jgi:glycosyltransferase involved in cell wall biosynthesis
MKLRTCQFNDSYPPIMDGVGIVARNYAFWLNRKYGKSCVVAPGVRDYRDKEEFRVFRYKSVPVPGLSPYRIGLPQIDLGFKKELLSAKFDLLHAHCPFVSGHLAKNMAKKAGIPLVTTFHSKYRDDFLKTLSSEFLTGMMLKMTMRFYTSAYQVWVPSKATGKTMREYGYRGPYEIVGNGADIDIPSETAYTDYRNKGMELINAGEGEFVFLFVGQHRWEKNVKLIIDALTILNKQEKLFRMIFAGEGYASDGMKSMVKEMGMEKKVKFLGVVCDREMLKSVYAAADLFVFPSLYDNAPLVIREAAAFGTPSVLIRGSSAAEDIEDRKNGFLIENSAEALAATLQEIMGHPVLVKTTGEGARRTVYRSWESIVDEVQSRYTDIVTTWRGGS